MKSITRLFCIIILLSLVGCGGENIIINQFEDSTWQEIFDEYRNSTVLVTAYLHNHVRSRGSGFFVSNNTVVTNNHVAPADDVDVEDVYVTLYNGVRLDVLEIDYSLRDRDIIFLTVKSQNIKPVKLGEYENLHVLDEIMHIGNPIGLFWTANVGHISAFRLAGNINIDWVSRNTKIIQHDISCDHGSSGGVIFNRYGEVVAIVFAATEGVTGEFRYSVSIDYIKSKLNRI